MWLLNAILTKPWPRCYSFPNSNSQQLALTILIRCFCNLKEYKLKKYKLFPVNYSLKQFSSFMKHGVRLRLRFTGDLAWPGIKFQVKCYRRIDTSRHRAAVVKNSLCSHYLEGGSFTPKLIAENSSNVVIVPFVVLFNLSANASFLSNLSTSIIQIAGTTLHR